MGDSSAHHETDVTALRLIAWNCNHGALAERVALLQRLTPKPDILFLQECRPGHELPLHGDFLSFTVNESKGIALGSLNPDYQLTEIDRREGCGRAVIAADVSGPVSFSLLGVWSQGRAGRDYVDDVLRSLEAYDELLQSGPAVVMGDFNSGPKLSGPASGDEQHTRLLRAFESVGLVSTYHLFHKVEHWKEEHATHRHTSGSDWHIDFCFVPRAWADRISNVEVLDDEKWRAESDHHPLVVDIL